MRLKRNERVTGRKRERGNVKIKFSNEFLGFNLEYIAFGKNLENLQF